MDEEINQIISDIYESAIDNSYIQIMLDRICKLVGAHQAMTILFSDIHFSAFDTFENADVVSLYNTEYKDQDYWAEALVKRNYQNRVFTGQELRPTKEFEKTDYYHDLMVPGNIYDCLGIAFKDSSPVHSAFVFHRQKREEYFDNYEKKLLVTIAPHLDRLAKIMHKFNFQSLNNNITEQALNNLSFGLIIINSENKVDYCNKAAKDILTSNDGLDISQGHLKAHKLNDSEMLTNLVSKALDHEKSKSSSISDQCIIHRKSLKLPYIVQVIPLNLEQRFEAILTKRAARGALAIITDPETYSRPSEQILNQLFGLTPTESSFAIQVSMGKSIKKIAEESQVSEGTARWHLKNIQSKTNLRKQSDIVRLVSNISPKTGNNV